VHISVPTRHLSPARLQDMFHIPYGYSIYKRDAKIQTDHNRVLIEIEESD
jgi:spermidine synthase